MTDTSPQALRPLAASLNAMGHSWKREEGMKNNREFVIWLFVVLMLIVLSTIWFFSSWDECRQQFSFWTCLRMLSKWEGG